MDRQEFDRLAGDGKIASAEFIKKDGSLRKMVFRTQVTKGVTGEGMKYNPSDYGLRTVFDMQKQEFRHINLNTIRKLTAHRKQWTIFYPEDITEPHATIPSITEPTTVLTGERY